MRRAFGSSSIISALSINNNEFNGKFRNGGFFIDKGKYIKNLTKNEFL